MDRGRLKGANKAHGCSSSKGPKSKRGAIDYFGRQTWKGKVVAGG